MRITVSGHIGSGKSTVSNFLGQLTGFKVYSGGFFFRKLAEDRGMTIEEFNKFAENDDTMDFILNREIEVFLRDNDNIIVESRLSGWIAHSSGIDAFKVFLDAPLDERIRRVGIRETSPDIRNRVISREESEDLRFRNYFNFDMDDKSIYDAVIDTTEGGADYVAKKIYSIIFPHG
ncbi:MAG: cytidylate kinase family protein [Candidatus Thermoplasmatota archaeon]|jgi:predicted cytidylate kinase|nr:cytidylate kinase family protein [Candidatus Thermoplasmatota archaeon]MCL5790968.1 cytidylate kinase family protein [Candidatus Thermoplasmatota archaeon]